MLFTRPICTEEGERHHGHSYYVEIIVEAAPVAGMIMDSELLKRLGQKVVRRLDHRLLNEVEGLGEPTIENIAKWVLNAATERVSGNVAEVKVWRPSVGDCAVVSPVPGDEA